MLIAEPCGSAPFAPRVYEDEEGRVLFAVDRSCWSDQDLLILACEHNCSTVHLIDLAREKPDRVLPVPHLAG